MKQIKIKLTGGMYDGQEYPVFKWQSVIHIPRRLTLEQMDALKIDDTRSWNFPDEVYEREIFMEADGTRRIEYVYVKTVHYKPEDFFANKEKGEK